MLASISSITYRIFVFHAGGMILRKRTLWRFESAAASGDAALRRLAQIVRQTQGTFASLGTQLSSIRTGPINQWRCCDFARPYQGNSSVVPARPTPLARPPPHPLDDLIIP